MVSTCTYRLYETYDRQKTDGIRRWYIDNLSSRKTKTKDSNVQLQKGDTVLHQIASDSPGSGTAQAVLNDFFDYCPSDVFLSVRADNLTANKFYVKMNMKLIGKTSWAKGTLPGNVYVKRKRSNTGLETE